MAGTMASPPIERLTAAQRIRCEALFAAVRLDAKRDFREGELIEVAERLERWIRGEETE